MSKVPIITIDGLASSGKTTISKSLSNHLGFYTLDSGILYRAFAYIKSVENIDKFMPDSGTKIINNMKIVPSKNLAVIGNVDSKNLSIINLDKNKVVSTIPLDTAPLGIVANASGDKVFITSWFKNQVLALSTHDFSVLHSFSVGITPSGIAFNEKYNAIVVANRDADTVEIYDADNYKLRKKVKVGSHPYGISTNSSFILVANVYDDTISIINM